MSTKHTPGPWTVNPHFNHGAEVRSLASVAWCSVASTHGASGSQVIDVAEARANARLIAAAPDLLEALEAAHGYLVMMGTDHADHIRGVCRAAIAKAKGKAHDDEA